MRIVGELAPALVEPLAAAGRCQTLEHVLAWAHAVGATLVEVIVQDEYTHDVVVACTPPCYLCFDST